MNQPHTENGGTDQWRNGNSGNTAASAYSDGFVGGINRPAPVAKRESYALGRKGDQSRRPLTRKTMINGGTGPYVSS